MVILCLNFWGTTRVFSQMAELAVHQEVLEIYFLFQQCLYGTDPEMSPVLSSNHHLFRTIFSAILCLWDQPTPYFLFGFLLPINHDFPDSSELFYWAEGCCQPHCQHGSDGLLHLSFSWLHFDHGNVALECGSLLPKLAKGKQERTKYLLKMQNQCQASAFFQDMEKPSQSEWSKTWMPWESPWFWRRIWPGTFGIWALWVCPCWCWFCDFPKND